MKRDKELIRKLVLALENSSKDSDSMEIEIDGYTSEQIGYHSYLMIQAGFAEGMEVTDYGCNSPQAILNNLTWAGHEFADAARDEKRWGEAISIVKEKSGSISVGVLTQLLTGLMKSALGLP